MSKEESEFVFVWRIERFNILTLERDEYITSPIFLVERFLNTKWYLRLNSNGEVGSRNNVSCYLCRDKDEGPEYITMVYELSVNNCPGKSRLAFTFRMEDTSGFNYDLISGKTTLNVYILECRMSPCLNEILDIELKMPKTVDTDENKHPFESEIRKELFLTTEKEFQKLRRKISLWPKHCFARSVFSVERRYIVCPVKDILCLHSNDLRLPVLSCSENPALLIILRKSIIREVEKLEVNLCFMDKLLNDILLICEVLLFDSSEICKMERSHLYEKGHIHEMWNAADDSFEWSRLKKYENGRLKFQLSISDGSYESNIESSESGSYVCLTPSKKLFPRDLYRLYEEKKFCDLTLKTDGKTFEAHKAVLCSMSPVFEAMFESDMKESDTNIITIDDMEADTVRQMLNFLYRGEADTLDFNGTMNLFSAADKYQIAPLKVTCRTFLLKNLSVENVISALLLADAHNDDELKESAAYFAYTNAVFSSQKWKDFSGDNPRLALEILQNIICKYI